MKKIYLMSFIIMATTGLFAQHLSDKKIEEKEIRKTALSYIESWFTADVDRIERVLHPEFVKHGIAIDGKLNEVRLTSPLEKVAFLKMIERKSLDPRPKQDWNIEIEILGVLDYSASVYISSVDYIDYVLMVKVEGEWKILNVIWETTSGYF